MIIVSIQDQLLLHRRRQGTWRIYPVSTSAVGPGNIRNSLRTPLGRHRIYARIGDECPPLTVFRGRKPVGLYDPAVADPREDWILTRILWLEGCETGFNRRGRVDTRMRYIYIHGTHDEQRIGTPASHGCIRMRNIDILELFEQCRIGETVLIRP
ncbi:MAG: L,D-transpeptidase [Zetaproteobacteria bacterium]|nr:MAG: L,D-transpeptidase [Zetaproteobacteria bacterium]